MEKNTLTPETENTELITREKIEGTPFTLVKTENTGWFLTLGRYRVSEEVERKHELIKRVIDKDWDLIMITVLTLIEGKNSVEKEEEKNKKYNVNNMEQNNMDY